MILIFKIKVLKDLLTTQIILVSNKINYQRIIPIKVEILPMVTIHTL